MNRFFDITLCCIGAAVFIPIMALVAIATLVGYGTPILFRQTRAGKQGRPFTLFKFRTMYARPDSGATFEAGSFARVTKLGRMLRRYKLDELPQLFNILRGDMSIIGPRPEVKELTDRYPDLFEQTLRVRPGLTDFGAIVFPNEHALLATYDDPDAAYRDLVLPVKLELSTQHLTSRTVWSDFMVLWATFCAIVGLRHSWSHIDAGALLQTRRDQRYAEGRG